MTPAAAIHLLEQAERTHKRALWRLAARELGRIVAAGMVATPDTRGSESAQEAARALSGLGIPEIAETPQASEFSGSACVLEPKRPSLIAFLAAHGIRDPGGELSGRDLDRWHRGKAFRRRLVRDDGALTLESAAELAWEHGFFDDVTWRDESRCPVTEDMLIAAIDREACGDFPALYPRRVA